MAPSEVVTQQGQPAGWEVAVLPLQPALGGRQLANPVLRGHLVGAQLRFPGDYRCSPGATATALPTCGCSSCDHRPLASNMAHNESLGAGVLCVSKAHNQRQGNLIPPQIIAVAPATARSPARRAAQFLGRIRPTACDTLGRPDSDRCRTGWGVLLPLRHYMAAGARERGRDCTKQTTKASQPASPSASAPLAPRSAARQVTHRRRRGRAQRSKFNIGRHTSLLSMSWLQRSYY